MGFGTRRVERSDPPPRAAPLQLPLSSPQVDGADSDKKPAAWVDRGFSSDGGVDGAQGTPREGRTIARMGAGAALTPLDDPPAGDVGGAGSGRARKTGLNAAKLEDRYPIKSGGMSAGDVKAAAAKIDADNDGKISQDEVDAFSRLAGDKGFADASARDAFRRFEAGAAMFALQPGRGISKKYLDQDWTREMNKCAGASASEIADVRKTLLSQADTQIAADVIPELAANEDKNFSDADRAAAKGVLRANGYGDVAIIDKDHDGKIGPNDRYVAANAGGKIAFFMDDIKATKGLNKAFEAYQKNPPAFMNPAKKDAFPSDKWEYKELSSSKVGWKLKDGVKGSEAVQAFIDNPSAFKCDCAAAKQMFELQALRTQLGDKNFDALVAKHGLFVGYGAAHKDGELSKSLWKDVGDASTKPADYQSGWMGYAQISVAGRPDLDQPLQDAGWSGEHFVVTVNEQGEKKVIAHPFGEIDAADFEQDLKKKIAADFGVDASKVRISYKPPHVYDVEKARADIGVK